MPTTQCPQCAGTVRAGVDEFCPSCGYPLFWADADDDSAADEEPSGPKMARLPGEAATPTGGQPTATDPEPDPPSAAPVPEEPAPPPGPISSTPWRAPTADETPPGPTPRADAGPQAQVRCRGCGHENPHARVLCERCGATLRPSRPAPVAPPPQPTPGASRRRVVLLAAAGLLAATVLLAGGLVAWLLWPTDQEPPAEPERPPPADPETEEPTEEPTEPVLRAGSTGQAVQAWQEQLSEVGHPVEADGVFGPATEAATRAFQTEAGLPADGVVDAPTRQAMTRRLE